MQSLVDQLDTILPYAVTGRVTRVAGLTIAASDLPAPLGAVCRIEGAHSSPVTCEVVGFRDGQTLLLPYRDPGGVCAGDRVSLKQSSPGVRVGDGLMGRVIDGRGRFLDGGPVVALPRRVALQSDAPRALDRPRIEEPLATGVRCIDSLLTCGKGQRLGIFSGSGVGKSTLLGQMARHTSADVNVVVLVGERGREVREFLERDLGEEGLARSVVVVATSDEPAVLRLRAAFLGTAVAEYFRDSGRDVLLMMDSVTRFALAQREIGLAAGEPPATRGYPPSVFAALPRLLERSGRTTAGSITGLYTVLVEGDDTNEPVADCVRGTLDGHVVLSRKLAERAHWPAVDVLASVSRSMNDVIDDEHRHAVETLKRLLAAYREAEDLISIGAYQAGSNPQVDAAVRMRDEIQRHLTQGIDEQSNYQTARDSLLTLHRLQGLQTQVGQHAGQAVPAVPDAPA